jgi:DNA polymerase epsilon subunit 1
MPLLVRALLKLGTRCSLDRPGEITLARARDFGLDLSQVDRSMSSKRKYLAGADNLNVLFLFHAASSSNAIHVFSLFTPSGTLRVFMVDPSASRQSLPSVKDVYAKFWKNRASEGALHEPPESLQIETSHHTSESAVHKAISRELATFEGQGYILVIGSNKDLSYYEYNIPKLEKFPAFIMNGPKSSHSLDVLMWQSHVVKKMLSRYFYVGSWLYQLYQKAGYYDVPIGNMEGDPTLFCADVDFARRLQKQDMVLWWSPLPKPDFGGLEEQNSIQGDVPNPEVVHPGCYSNVSMRVSIHNLAVDAVLQSPLLNELEGSGGATAFDTANHNLDDYSKGVAQPNVTMADSSMTTQVFGVLRGMIKSWLIDAYENPEGPAARNIEHFWRWLCSNGSNMHDPNLPQFVRGLMKKTFYQLLSEFKRLGSNIIHADFSSILIVTSKPPGAAYAYATYITTAVTAHDLFQHIVLRTENYYDFLLFMDPTNFCGVVCEAPEALPSTSADSALPLQTTFNIARFLPPIIQETFLDAIRFFVAEMAGIKLRNNDHARTPLKVIQNLSQEHMPSQDASKMKETEDTRTFITQRLTRRLLQITSRIIKQHQDAALDGLLTMPEWRFPTLPGSRLHLTDQPLEFVKFLCGALSPANHEYGIELGILRRNLLELVGVKEFSEKAKFKDPCDSLKLPMVVCENCDDVRDFDFCRDPELIPAFDPDGNPMTAGKWQPICPGCGSLYSKLGLELSLIALMDVAMEAYNSQDLTCKRCKSVMDTNVALRCMCASDWEGKMGKSEVKRKFITVEGIAKFCGMDRARVSATSYRAHSLAYFLR